MERSHDLPDLLTDEAVALVGQWLASAEGRGSRRELRSANRLHDLVQDPSAVAFTMRFVDRVVRTADDRVAARHLRSLVAGGAPLPSFLTTIDRLLLRTGSALAPLLPGVVMPLARGRMRQLVGHLVVDADDAALARHLSARREAGFQLNVNLLGEAVLGEAEAARRLATTTSLLSAPGVDYVSVKITGIASQLQHWAHDDSLQRICERLRTVFRAARDHGTFVNLDMEEHRDLQLTVDAFTTVLAEEEFLATRAGIVVQTYLPDALGVLDGLTSWASDRVGRGGAPIKVRIVKGANLAMERVDAAMHGWELAPYGTKAETDANFKRCLDVALRSERTEAVQIGVASHNLFDLAWTCLLADRRGVSEQLTVEMLEGMAPAVAEAVRDSGRSVLLYTPVVRPGDFEVAIAYLFRRLEENASPGNFIHALGDLSDDPEAFAAQEAAFRAAVASRFDVRVGRSRGRVPAAPSDVDQPFANEPESDPTDDVVRGALGSSLTRPLPARTSNPPTSIPEVDRALERAREAQRSWSALPPQARAAVLHRVGDALSQQRSALIGLMAAEGRKTIAQADPEVCEAVDFARYYARRCVELVDDDAAFAPYGVVAVIPPWNFPVAIPTGGMLAALAAGSAVVVKPAPEVPRCTEAVVACCHAAGIPADLLQVVPAPEDHIGRHLITQADAVILTGSIETADLFRSWRPDMALFAETSGKNAIVITPSADIDLAVRDLVASAFGHAGQKCSAASLAVGVGGVFDDPRFRRQLIDAVTSIEVGPATSPATSMTPLITEANPRLARALTTLDPGESWLVEPRRLAADTWTPGVRIGVRPGSWLARTECFGPVLGLIAARDLDEAIDIQNSSEFGLTGGIHSLDDEEIERWLDRVEVGNAYVNRAITGAIVQRQPFGGWKRSVIGPGAKAGGPGYVAQLGTWIPTTELSSTRWRESDARALREIYDRGVDASGLFCESNVLRHRRRPAVGLWIDDLPDPAHTLAQDRIVDAAQISGVPLIHRRSGEPSSEFVARVVAAGAESIRVIGEVRHDLRGDGLRAGVLLIDGPVTNSGRQELRTFFREQAVSRTLHRFGNLVDATR